MTPVRRALRAVATKSPRGRRMLELGQRELDTALRDDLYDGEYYGGSAAQARETIGTADYTRDSTNANAGAYLVWRYIPAQKSLDTGCAFGFVVEALRELGVDAEGVDVSRFALDHAALGARGHIRYGNLLHKLPVRDGAYDVVTAFETLEHLPPEAVPAALRELARCTNAYVVATIPSFGENKWGPGGWFDVKVRPERLDYYRGLGPSYDGPVPFEDLFRNEDGEPIEGHLTIASFDWWTKQFAEAGLVRCGETERRMHPNLARFGLTKFWNIYVFRRPDVLEPDGDVRSAREIADVEARFGLDERVADPVDVRRVRDSIGEGAFEGVPLRLAEA